MTSCLDNDVEQITYTSETSITGFSLGTLNIDRIGKDKNGLDSPYVDTLDCSNYPFTINQLTREIENKDSLPYGTHIDKVITNVTYDAGILVYKPKGAEKDTYIVLQQIKILPLNLKYGLTAMPSDKPTK